jgi:hypothetical protein
LVEHADDQPAWPWSAAEDGRTVLVMLSSPGRVAPNVRPIRE